MVGWLCWFGFVSFFLCFKKLTYVGSVGNVVRELENHFSKFPVFVSFSSVLTVQD